MFSVYVFITYFDIITMYAVNSCRLCLNTGLLVDLFQVKDNTSLSEKVMSCVDIKIFPGDGLPSVICGSCETIVNQFYRFKQTCLKVDRELKKSTEVYKNCIEKKCVLTNITVKNFGDATNECSALEIKPEITDEKIIHLLKEDNESISIIPNKIKPGKLKKSQVFQCEHCGNTFAKKSILKNHLLTHFNVKMYSCKMCSKQFTRAEHLRVHMRIHNGIRPYVCEVCGRSSTKRQDLIRHLKVHSDEKKYKCSRCDRRFKRSSDVHSHMRSHTGSRPYSCDKCDKTYTSHSGYKKHCMKHSQQK